MIGSTYVAFNLFAVDHRVENFVFIFYYLFSSIEAFVLEMQMEYSKLNLWLNNTEVADSWLMEYEPHADKPDKLGTTIRVVRLQLHENQVFTLKKAECTTV